MMQLRILNQSLVERLYLTPTSPLGILKSAVPGFETIIDRYVVAWELPNDNPPP